MLEKIKKFINKKIVNNSISLKKSSFIAFGLGSLLVLAFAPFNLFFFAIVSLSLFYAMIEQKKCSKQISILAFFYMFGFFVFGVYWICNSLFIDLKRFGWLIPFAITLIPALMATYFAIIIYLYHKLKTRYAINLAYQKILLFSASFLIFEVIRSNYLLDFHGIY